MNRTVTLDQFQSLWTAAGSDRFPFPLRYRTDAKWENEQAARMHAADEWRRGLHDVRLDRAIRLLHSGQITIEMYGQCCDDVIRVRVACDDTLGVLACQHGDRVIDLTTVETGTLGAAVVAQIPPSPPGRELQCSASTRQLSEPSEARSVLVSVVDDEPRALRRLLARERSGWGNIRVFLTDDYSRCTRIADLGWIDVANDGRYMLTSDTYTTATPASPEGLISEVSRLVANAQRRRRGEVQLPR